MLASVNVFVVISAGAAVAHAKVKVTTAKTHPRDWVGRMPRPEHLLVLMPNYRPDLARTINSLDQAASHHSQIGLNAVASSLTRRNMCPSASNE